MTADRDALNWGVDVELKKWDHTESFQLGCAPDAVEHFKGNMLLNNGIARLLDLLIGAGGQALDSTHCRIGVGDSTTAASAAQTDLQAASNKYYKLCSSVSRSSQTITVVATFGSSQGNFAWEEWGIDFGTADGSSGTAPLLNRKVTTMGTKASGSSWQLSVSITVS